MLRQLMIYYIKVYSLPRSQAMRFDSKHQSHCLSCIFSQKIQFAFVDCSSICKQCLCIYKGSNTHGIANLPCVFCLLGCSPNPCEHHGTVMAAHSCGVLKERFEKREACIGTMQNNGFGLCPTSSCKARGFVYTKTLLARELRRTRMVPRSTACRSYCIHLNCQFRSQLLYWTHQKFIRRQLP